MTLGVYLLIVFYMTVGGWLVLVAHAYHLFQLRNSPYKTLIVAVAYAHGFGAIYVGGVAAIELVGYNVLGLTLALSTLAVCCFACVRMVAPVMSAFEQRYLRLREQEKEGKTSIWLRALGRRVEK